MTTTVHQRDPGLRTDRPGRPAAARHRTDAALAAPGMPHRTRTPELVGPGPATNVHRRAKRALDRLVALTTLIVTLPLTLLVAAAILVADGGSVFYRQERIGLHGRPFTMLKFRTMRVGADTVVTQLAHVNEGAGPLFKIRRDPRVTPVGRVLRRLSLDELPQLVNVLAGDMSIVGPRPALAREVRHYTDREAGRLLVEPGLTGLWQVSGRSDLDWETSVELDLRYVREWSLWLDAKIVGRTVGAVLTARGAY